MYFGSTLIHTNLPDKLYKTPDLQVGGTNWVHNLQSLIRRYPAKSCDTSSGDNEDFGLGREPSLSANYRFLSRCLIEDTRLSTLAAREKAMAATSECGRREYALFSAASGTLSTLSAGESLTESQRETAHRHARPFIYFQC